MTRVVTDGAADLPAELASSLGITVVTGTVRFGDDVWRGDAVEFWRALRAGGPAPATAAPSVAQLSAAYGDGATPVLAVHVSSELSETFAHAQEAGGGRVRVVDSRSLSVGTGLLAMVAAEPAEDALAEAVGRLQLYALIDDVGFLVRGGRAGLVGDPGGRRSHRHVMTVKGHAIPLDRVRHRRDAVGKVLERARQHAPAGADRWAVGHGDAADVDAFVERLGGVFGSAPAYVTTLGPPVGVHVGPDALIVAFLA